MNEGNKWTSNWRALHKEHRYWVYNSCREELSHEASIAALEPSRQHANIIFLLMQCFVHLAHYVQQLKGKNTLKLRYTIVTAQWFSERPVLLEITNEIWNWGQDARVYHVLTWMTPLLKQLWLMSFSEAHNCSHVFVINFNRKLIRSIEHLILWVGNWMPETTVIMKDMR